MSEYFREKHVQEFEIFKSQFGNAVDDIINYFFELSPPILEGIFKEYETIYGNSSAKYARQTFKEWKAKRRRISGQTAKRLFNIVPSYISPEQKLDLAEKIWLHLSPMSNTTFTISPTSCISEFSHNLVDELEEKIKTFAIPVYIQNSFKWLAGNDITLYQKMLNHFKFLNKGVAIQKIVSSVAILQQQAIVNSNRNIMSYETKFYNHTVYIKVADKEKLALQENYLWVLWLVFGIIGFIALSQ